MGGIKNARSKLRTGIEINFQFNFFMDNMQYI
jgi:hypothetical protein